MFSPAEKANRNTTTVQKRTEGSFFRKVGEETFFGARENPSFFGSGIQPKLTISSPDDPQEKEADAMADHVMRMTDPSSAPPSEKKEEEKLQPKEEEEVQPKLGGPVINKLQCKEDEEEKVQPKLFGNLQRSQEESDDADVSAGCTCNDNSINRKNISLHRSDVIQCSGRGPPAGSIQFGQELSSSKGGGSPLPDNTRQFMESRFQADFSNVRIHTGSSAEYLSRNIHAQAFTQGSDIYFNAGKYSPHSGEGSLLLAHELTHTIQQGASKTNNTSQNSPINPAVARKNIVQRSAEAAVPQLANAVQKAKTMEGKINAKKPGPDGYRTGWEHLLEIFKSTFGEDKIVSGSGGTSVPGTVSEMDIKKYREAKGVQIVDPTNTDRTITGERDAMPSWCGIFVFWALNKSGVPMPKWKIGRNVLKPQSLNPPGSTPRPGDIAWRRAYSHFAIVESVSGDTIRTVNGNTAGEDNMGGQVQSKEHPMSNWTGFFNPLVAMEGTLGSGEGPVNEKPKTLQELRREMFNVNRKQESDREEDSSNQDENAIQPKAELSNWNVDAGGRMSVESHKQTSSTPSNNIQQNELQAKDEEKKEEEENQVSLSQPTVQKKQDYVLHCKAGCCPGEQNLLQLKYAQREDSEHVDSSPNSYSNAETSVNSAERDRGPPVQAKGDSAVIHRSVIDDALSFVGSVTDCITIDLDEAKRCGLQKAQEVALHIPGYRALRVVLGSDPITGENIERNGRNFIEAAFDIMPGGMLLHQKLDEIHQLDAAAAWIDEQIARIETIVNDLFSAFDNFWNELGVSDFTSPMDVLRRGANIVLDFINNVIDFAVTAATELLRMVKDYLLSKIVDFIKEHTTAYPLLTVILGKDPVTDQEVERNGTNILNALLELGGEEGRMQRTQMQETGTFDRIVAYIDEGIAVFSGAYEEIVQAFRNIWDVVSIDSLMDPVGTFTEIYNQFAGPIERVWNFVSEVAAAILQFIKEVLMQRLAAWARTVRGYPLVTVLIGKDPFTDQPVPRTMTNIIRGFMSLMEGGEEQFNQLQESGAIGRTTARINAAVARLNMTPEYVVQLFIDLWNSFSLSDLANPIAAFRRILDRFGEPIRRLIAFVWEIIKIVIEVILQIMNFPIDLINNIITKAMQAIDLIKRDPVGFLKNLLRAIKQGFIQFFDNILQHLLQGLVGWLMSELRDANMPPLPDLTLRGVIGWVLQVLGISMEKIWEKLAAHPRIGPQRVARIRSMINTLEGIWTFIKDVQERGMAAIWDKIQEQLSNLWNMVLDAVKNWIMEQIVTRMVTRLLSMLDPTGIMAVINSAIALYNAIQSFIRYLREMLEIVNSFVEGVVEIASGNIRRAADFLERTLARSIPVIIGFLANQVGLTGIGRRIGEMIERVREMVDQALTWLVNKAVDTGAALLDRIMVAGRAAVGAVLGWLGFRQRFTTTGGVDHTVYVRQSGTPALIIESTPIDVLTFFTQKQTEINANTSMPPAEKTTLLGRITHGRNLVQGLQALMNSDATHNNPRIPTMITEIIAIIRELDPASTSVVPPATPVISPPYSMAKANSFSAMYLHKGGTYRDRSGTMVTVPKNHPDGSEPGSNTLSEAFQILTGMRLNNRWVRFHILNADFGGLGIDSNLIPTPNYINNPEYLHELENPVKGFYHSGLPIWLRASMTYRTNMFNGLFVNTYSATAGAMKFQNNQWVEDPTKQRSFSKNIDVPESNSFNINHLISDPSSLTLLVNLSTVTTAMFEILRNRQPSGGYTYFRQMERAIGSEVLGADVISLDPEVIAGLNPTAAQLRTINDYRNRLGSVNWTF